MSDIDPRAIAQERLAARQHRFHRIRTRVAAGAAAVFIAVFGGLMVQLASGSDPGLAAGGSQADAAVVSNTASSASQTQSSTTTSSPTPSAVTTSQS